MIQEVIRAITLIICSILSSVAFGQQQYIQPGPPVNQYGCNSCDTGGPVYQEWAPQQSYFEQGDCSTCGPGPISRVRNAADAIRSRRPAQFAGQDISYGRPGNLISAPYIDGKCGDCNWGPIYGSIFAGVAFIDNFDTRFTFDNGTAGEIGARETGFSTLDGLAAGGAIGRYFYRQARVEFEYTYRDNGIGDFNELTFDDVLATPQINDNLVDSVITDAQGNIDSSSFMWNILIDLQPRTVGCANAYAGGGIGVLLVESDITTPAATFDISDTSFAFQGIFGVNFAFRERADLFTEYRYLGADSIGVTRMDLAGVDELGRFRFDSHSLVFGMRFLR